MAFVPPRDTICPRSIRTVRAQDGTTLSLAMDLRPPRNCRYGAVQLVDGGALSWAKETDGQTGKPDAKGRAQAGRGWRGHVRAERLRARDPARLCRRWRRRWRQPLPRGVPDEPRGHAGG